MKKLHVYLDTSVIGGCFDDEFSEYSMRLIEQINNGKYFAIISELTIEELIGAPDNIKSIIMNIPEQHMTIVKPNDEVAHLADKYLENRIISYNFKEDALHIAYATIFGADMLVSWNFKHVVNFTRIKKYNAVNSMEGYRQIEIISPMELYYEEEI